MILSAPMRSTAIADVEYDTEERTLEVTFASGRSYTHVGVPQTTYEALVNAGSPGSYYNSHIKGAF